MLTLPSQSTPTFLVGAERSGTTMLRLMLDGHPQLAFRYEFELAVDLVGDDGQWPELDRYYEHLRTFRWVDPPPYIDRSLDYPSLVRSFLEQKRAKDRKPLVGATVHRHYDRLLHIWPDARFIHIVRDGRDVARSNIAMGWAGNVWTGSEPWMRAERLWESVSRSLAPDRWIDVRYEDLVLAPRETLERLCAFARIRYDAAMLDYPGRSPYRAPDASRAGQWQTALSPREIQLVESQLGEMLVERGYPLSGLPPITLGPAHRVGLRTQCRAHRARDAARALGPSLWLQRMLAERFAPTPWRDRVRLQINDVINAQLR